MSNIEWTDRTWNPATGCTQISPGCKNCYAKTLSKRLKAMGQEKYRNNFEYTEHEKYLDEPLKWKKPSMIFVNSMSDLFHEKSTDKFLYKVFATMMKAKWHTYQILTKRADLMELFFRYHNHDLGFKTVPKHIWIGTSVESSYYLFRIERLKNIKAETKFVSFEPLLERIGNVDLKGINWAIVGGESGPNFRDVIKKEWVIELRDICRRDGVKFFFKQWGGRYPKEKGNMLDGKQYQEYPEVSN